MVGEKVMERLRGTKVSYRILETEPVYACEAAAEATGTRLHQHVKSLLLSYDKHKPVLALLQGDKRVDLNRVSTEYVAMSPRDLLKVVKVKMTRISC